jgi:hypothetical protein
MALRKRPLDTACLSHVCCLATRKKQGAPPRGSMGLASVREKRRSRHACQALLLFLHAGIRTVPISASVYSRSAIRLSSFRSPLCPCNGPPLWEGLYLPEGHSRAFAVHQLPKALPEATEIYLPPPTRGGLIDERKVSMLTLICPFGN